MWWVGVVGGWKKDALTSYGRSRSRFYQQGWRIRSGQLSVDADETGDSQGRTEGVCCKGSQNIFRMVRDQMKPCRNSDLEINADVKAQKKNRSAFPANTSLWTSSLPWRVDPNNIKVTEVDALFIFPVVTGATFGPHMVWMWSLSWQLCPLR